MEDASAANDLFRRLAREPRDELPQPPRLTRRFALYAGIALVLAAGLGLLLARQGAEREARREVVADARFMAGQLGRDDLTNQVLNSPARGDILADLDDLFALGRFSADVRRFTLFDRNGRVMYSSEHALIGRRGDVAKVRRALAGRTVYGRVELADGRDALESYVPVYWLLAEPAFPSGVLAVHSDYAPVAREIRDDTLVQAGAMTLALLVLYGASFPILRRLTSTLRVQNAELIERSVALQASEERYRLIVETAAEGVWLIDEHDKTVFANEKLAALLGIPRERLVGRPLAELVATGDRQRLEPAWLRRRHGAGEERELTLLRADGSGVRATVSTNPVLDREGAYLGALVMVTDITSRARVEEALRELEERIRQTNELEAAGRRASHMADDFNDFVNAMRAYADLLLSRLPPDDPLREEATQIRRGAEGASALTRQLVAVRHRLSLKGELLDLGKVARGLSDVLGRLVEDGVTLEIKADPRLGCIRADRAQVEQALVSLVAHACDGLDPDATVSIDIRNAQVGEDFARAHPPQRAGDYVLLELADDQGFLDERTWAPMFDPFTPGHTETRGTELALDTVYGLVKQNDGFVWLEAKRDGGWSLALHFPRAGDDPDPEG